MKCKWIQILSHWGMTLAWCPPLGCQIGQGTMMVGYFWVDEKVEVVLANHHLFSKEGPSTKVHILFPFHVVDYGDNLSGRIL